jgi:flagellum-specific peptidoglycan hydrolase FlgJ
MGYTIAQAKTFIEQIAPLMQKEAKKRGYIIVSTAISQSVVESAAGTSSLGYR